jgi:hypothetical protein
MKMRPFWPLLACLAFAPLAILTTGCNNKAAEYCDFECDCTRCSARDYDACVVWYEAEEDKASAYDCDPEYDDLHRCVMNNVRCGTFWWDLAVTCGGRFQDVNRCVDRGSRL